MKLWKPYLDLSISLERFSCRSIQWAHASTMIKYIIMISALHSPILWKNFLLNLSNFCRHHFFFQNNKNIKFGQYYTFLMDNWRLTKTMIKLFSQVFKTVSLYLLQLFPVPYQFKKKTLCSYILYLITSYLSKCSVY